MLVVMAHRREQIADVMVMERVEDVPAVAPRAHEPSRAQQPQMMGGGAHAQLRDRCELLNGAWTSEQVREQSQSPRRSERLERLGELLGLVGTEDAGGDAVFRGVGHDLQENSYEHTLTCVAGAATRRARLPGGRFVRAAAGRDTAE